MAVETSPAFQFTGTAVDRFWAKVEQRNSDQCWLWHGAADARGYGIFWDGATNVRAHRFSCALAGNHARIAGVVLHRCDNPACVNPSHLVVGTQKDNIHDRNRKHRHNLPRGERHWNASITADKVDAIHSLACGGYSYSQISRATGVSPTSISRVLSGTHRVEGCN